MSFLVATGKSVTVNGLTGRAVPCIFIPDFPFPHWYIQPPLVHDCVDVQELLKQDTFKT